MTKREQAEKWACRSRSDLTGQGSTPSSRMNDLTGLFCASRIERLEYRKERKHAEKDVHSRADRGQTTPGRSAAEPRQNCPAGLQGSGHRRSDLLPLAEGIRRPAIGASQETERSAERKCAAQARPGYRYA